MPLCMCFKNVNISNGVLINLNLAYLIADALHILHMYVEWLFITAIKICHDLCVRCAFIKFYFLSFASSVQ